MTILERLKIELSQKDYFTDEIYTMYLQENNLSATATYNKEEMQKQLLMTIVDILEAVSNDVDLMRKVGDTTTGLSTSEASKLMKDRIQDIKNRIASIPEPQEEYSNISLLFTRRM